MKAAVTSFGKSLFKREFSYYYLGKLGPALSGVLEKMAFRGPFQVDNPMNL